LILGSSEGGKGAFKAKLLSPTHHPFKAEKGLCPLSNPQNRGGEAEEPPEGILEGESPLRVGRVGQKYVR